MPRQPIRTSRQIKANNFKVLRKTSSLKYKIYEVCNTGNHK